MKKSSGAESFPLGSPSTSCGQKCFEWLISPQTTESFIANIWEKKPIVIRRDRDDYHSGIITRRTIENFIKNDQEFAANSILLSRGAGDEKETYAESVLDAESLCKMVNEEGWICQVVHPQQKSAKVHALLERLENWSGSLWGSNYFFGSAATNPADAMSDNVELFVMQLEGKSHWKVFEGETKLSRDAGCEFQEEDLGPSIIDEELEAGDLIYIPRGYIYSSTGLTSFAHLSLSTYQTQSWCDMLSTALTDTLDKITRSNLKFREGLPINWLNLFGKSIEETETNKSNRDSFRSNMKDLLDTLIDSIDIDDVADQIASDFVALRTPPVARKRPNEEESKTFGPDPRKSNDLQIRIRNPSWMRIVVEDEEEGKLLIFSCLDNDVSQHMKTDNPLEAEPTSLEIVGTKSLEGLKQLVREWPNYCPIDIVSRDVLGELWEHGLIETAEDSSKKPRTI
jgi:lysine-specific demethylase/histidyl-hydroxylase NO66